MNPLDRRFVHFGGLGFDAACNGRQCKPSSSFLKSIQRNQTTPRILM